MGNPKQMISRISIFMIVLSMLTGCSEAPTPKNIKTIKGTFGEWENPFELRMVEENDSSFTGIVKWKNNDSWTYAEGQFIGNDSLIFHQLDNFLGFGIVINGQWPAAVIGDTIKGKWLHPTNPGSGNSYQGVIIEKGAPLSKFEKDVLDLFENEKAMKTELNNLDKQIYTIWSEAQKKKVKRPPQIDSLHIVQVNIALDLLESVMPFYQKYIHSKDSLLIHNEMNKRLGKYFSNVKLDSIQLTKFRTLLENNPEGSAIHYRLSSIIYDQKLLRIRETQKDNTLEIYREANQAFLKSFIDKKIHPQEEIFYLYDFTYGLYQFDQSYYTFLMDKTNNLRGHIPDKSIDMLESVINRIDQSSKLSTGSLAPDFSAKNLNGKEIVLSSFKGKVVCLEFWASSCGPCRSSTPKLKKIHKQFSNDIVMIGIALEDASDAQKYIKEYEIAWSNIAAQGKEEKYLRDLYCVNGIPTLFLIDKEGKIALRTHPNDKELLNKIQTLL